MTFRHFHWLILGIAFLIESGQMKDVFGMPSRLFMGGSNLCFDFGSSPGLQEIHSEYIAYEVLFSDETSLIANTSYCNLDVWIEGSKGILLHGRDKGSFHKIDARLKIENPEFYKVMKVRCMIPSFLTCRDHTKNVFSDTASNRVNRD